MEIALPAYFPPGLFWDQIISSGVNGYVIMNPDNGPGDLINASYVSAVNRAQNAGLKVLGYVYTSYGLRNRVDVKADIDTYKSRYGVDGIFLDEVSLYTTALSHFQDLADYVRATAGTYVVLNPGSIPDVAYMSIADSVVIFEGDYTTYTTWQSPSWAVNYPANKISHLVYATLSETDMTDTIRLAGLRNAGRIYVTDYTLPNQWNTLASYWQAELTILGAQTAPTDMRVLATLQSLTSKANVVAVAPSSNPFVLDDSVEGVLDDVHYPLGVVDTGRLPLPFVQAAMQANASRTIPGHPVRIFKIPQVVNLTYPVSTYEGIIMNNYPVQHTDFRLVRGVNNAILFFVRNIDRKPVSMQVNDQLVINIVDTINGTLLMQRELVPVDLAKGLYNFITLPAEMDGWPTGPVQYSVTYTTDDLGTMMLWTDQNYSPYSSIHITQNPIPGPSSTTTLDWSDFILNDLDGLYYSPSLRAAAQDGFVNGLHTFVFHMTGFSGTIRIDGTLVPSPESADWFQVSSTDFTNGDANQVLNVQGNYIEVRVAVDAVDGMLDQLQYKE